MPKRIKTPSRASRWAAACELVRQGLDDLNELRDEYQDWYDNLPESLQGNSPVSDKLQEVIDCGGFDDIDSALSELEGLDLPLGFGRD